MELKEMSLKVLPLSIVPTEYLSTPQLEWLVEFGENSYVQAHIDDEAELSELDNWVLTNFPELALVDSFLIHIDVNLEE